MSFNKELSHNAKQQVLKARDAIEEYLLPEHGKVTTKDIMEMFKFIIELDEKLNNLRVKINKEPEEKEKTCEYTCPGGIGCTKIELIYIKNKKYLSLHINGNIHNVAESNHNINRFYTGDLPFSGNSLTPDSCKLIDNGNALEISEGSNCKILPLKE